MRERFPFSFFFHIDTLSHTYSITYILYHTHTLSHSYTKYWFSLKLAFKKEPRNQKPVLQAATPATPDRPYTLYGPPSHTTSTTPPPQYSGRHVQCAFAAFGSVIITKARGQCETSRMASTCPLDYWGQRHHHETLKRARRGRGFPVTHNNNPHSHTCTHTRKDTYMNSLYVFIHEHTHTHWEIWSSMTRESVQFNMGPSLSLFLVKKRGKGRRKKRRRTYKLYNTFLDEFQSREKSAPANEATLDCE